MNETRNAADNRIVHPDSLTLALFLSMMAAGSVASAARAAPVTLRSESVGEGWGARSLVATPIVAIQPLGGVAPELVVAVAMHIERTFAVDLILLPAKSLPESALYRPRMRFRGERVIDWLEDVKPPNAITILGVMSSDLSVTKGQVHDWGVMGVASPLRAAGVVSTHRLGGKRDSANLVTRRACQVAVHELGHSLRLPHCSTPRCVMNDAEGSIAPVDRSSGKFCGTCRGQLEGLLR